MKNLVLALLCIGLVVCDAKRPGKHHSHKSNDEAANHVPTGNKPEELLAERVVAERNPSTGELELKDQKILVNVMNEDPVDEVDDSNVGDKENSPRINPCAKMQCEEGLECQLDEAQQPFCTCMKECPNDPSNVKVCSSANKTFDSECHLYRQRCLCQRGLSGCEDPANKDMQLEYLQSCQELALCTADEMEDFPRRMGDWLFQVMKELARRDTLDPQYKRYEKRSEKKYQPGHPLPHPILWKFCDLDKGPNDRYISRKELMPIRAPLIPFEHCIAPFLDDCDTDNDHKLTLVEWGACLKLKDAEIEDICSVAMGSRKSPRSSGDEIDGDSNLDDEADE